MRTVIPAQGWPYEYRARVIQRVNWRGKGGWSFIGERKWVHWNHDKTSRIYPTEEEAHAAAHRWLDKKEGLPLSVGEYV